MKSRTIKVDYLARVEGEGALYLRIKDNQIADAKFRIFEPPRFFEAFLLLALAHEARPFEKPRWWKTRMTGVSVLVVAGNIGINLGVAAPMAFFPFSGWKDSFFGDMHGQGMDAVEFFTQKKVVIERWPKEWSRKF